jgi:hypothetical protein
VQLGHVALDGTKIQANASVHKAMSYGRMREAEKRLAAEAVAWLSCAEAIDAEEDAAGGSDRRGDEVSEWVVSKQARLQRIREAKARLEAEAKASPPDDDGPGPSSGMMKSGKPQRGPDGGPPDRAQRNFTDPDSRIQPGVLRRGDPGVQLPDRGRCCASDLCRPMPADKPSRCPSAPPADRRHPRRIAGQSKEVSADAGYCEEANLARISPIAALPPTSLPDVPGMATRVMPERDDGRPDRARPQWPPSLNVLAGLQRRMDPPSCEEG